MSDTLVELWTAIYDGVYSSASRRGAAHEADYSGCRSGLSGEDLPAADLDAWADGAVSQILALAPRSVLEVGAGSGILALPLCRELATYVGVDVSDRAVRLLHDLPLPPGRARFAVAAADEITGLGRHDAVVFHSVVHHFPDRAYLAAALDRAAAHLRPGGAIYLGDVVDYELRRPYWLDVLSRRQPGETTRDEAMGQLASLCERDLELTITPAALARLARQLGLIPDIRLKPAPSPFEMYTYRWDAVLHSRDRDLLAVDELVGVAATDLPEPADWAAYAPFVVRAVPHPGRVAALGALAALASAAPGAPLELRRLFRSTADQPTPAELREVATARGLQCLAQPTPGRRGHVDVLVTEDRVRGLRYRPAPDEVEATSDPRSNLASRRTPSGWRR